MMRKFEVVLNRCYDMEYENDVTCDVPGCGQLGSCAILFGRRVCSTCLSAADQAIAKAIYEAIGKPRIPYEEKPTQTFPVGTSCTKQA